MYEMKEEYYTGIEMIDEEHTKLIQLCEDTYQLLNNDYLHDKFDQINTLTTELREYTKQHFADEEAYMRSINYRGLYQQKTMHREFIQKLEAIDLDVADENQQETIVGLLTFLTDWLINHILKMDKKIG